MSALSSWTSSLVVACCGSGRRRHLLAPAHRIDSLDDCRRHAEILATKRDVDRRPSVTCLLVGHEGILFATRGNIVRHVLVVSPGEDVVRGVRTSIAIVDGRGGSGLGPGACALSAPRASWPGTLTRSVKLSSGEGAFEIGGGAGCSATIST